MKILAINIILFLGIMIQSPCYGQMHLNHDTISFDKFIGIVYDIDYAPFGSRNIFPKDRFKPTREEIDEFESQFLSQYGSAIEKHHLLFYDDYKLNHSQGMTEEDWKEITKYKDDRKKYATDGVKQLKKEINDFDRSYYGYIGLNGMRYLRIEFTPHKEKWFEIPGTGESHLHNLPPLVYNLDKHELSWAGWTGEKDSLH